MLSRRQLDNDGTPVFGWIMTKISKSDFLACVKKSCVIDESRLDQFLSESDSDDPVELATRMVRHDLLTRWQAKYLMAGRTRLDIGSYRLLDRISRDELGDRFLATHKQLGRKVDIQILPANVSKNKELCESFLQAAGRTAKLDHPNLVHVYDIDQEGGRYFLVTEHVEGITLDSANRDSMTSLDVGRLVSQAITGIECAHQNQVTHGNLRQSDFVLTPNDSVKIQHLGVSSLRSLETNEETDDVDAITKIGQQLLTEIPEDDDRMRLEELLQKLTSADRTSIGQFQQEMSEWIKQEDRTYGADVAAPTSQTEDLATADQPFEPEESTFEEDDEYEDDEYEDEFDEDYEEAGFLRRLLDENPVALIATVIVVGAILVVGTAWGTYGYMSNAAMAKKIAEAKAKSTSPKRQDSATLTNQSQPNENSQAQVKTTSGVLSQPVEEASPDFADTEAMKRLIAETIPGQSSEVESKNVQPAEMVDAAPQANPTERVDNQPADPIPNEPKSEVAANSETPVAEPRLPSATGNMFARKEPVDDVEKKIEESAEPKKNDETPTGSTAPSVSADVNPFEKFPRIADLPPIENLSETSLGRLVISNRYLMGAEIYADPAIGKGRMIFEMSRDPVDKQKWNVTVRRREKEKPTEIAYFRKSDTEFLFGWLPEAEKNRNSQYLRNCLIKLKVPNFSQWLTLRKPIELEPIVFTSAAPIFKISTEIPHLPKLEEISIEILPVRDIPDVETNLSPSTIEFLQGMPGRILLKESDANAFVWIEVDAKLKSKLELTSSFVLLLANGRREPIKKLEALDELALSLKQYEMKAFSDWEIAKNTRAPSGKGEEYDKIRSELEKAANRAKSQTLKAAEYASIVPKLLDRPISIRMYAKLGDHRTELAVTKKSSNK